MSACILCGAPAAGLQCAKCRERESNAADPGDIARRRAAASNAVAPQPAPAAARDAAALVLHLPLPPSTNAAWRAVNGRVLLSAKARRWKREAALAVEAQRRGRFVGGRVAVEIDATFPRKRRDLDNIAKLTLDAMKGACMEDDSLVYDIHLRKHVGARPGLVVTVRAFSEEARAA